MGTYVTGPVQMGTGLDNTGTDTGYVVSSQTALINRDATLVQSATFRLPANAQIVDIFVDVITAYDSATSATVSAGTTAGGTEYLSGISAKTAGRRPNAYSGAQVGAIANVGNNTTLVATVTSVGQPTVGQLRVTVLYAQK